MSEILPSTKNLKVIQSWQPGNLCPGGPSCQTDHAANEVVDLEQMDLGANKDKIQ